MHWIDHFHINNNYGKEDLHNSLQQGNIPIKELLHRIESLCLDATISQKVTEAKLSLEWLVEAYKWKF